MRRLGWFIKVLLTFIGRLNFYRKFFAIYLPLNISNPAGEKAHLPLLSIWNLVFEFSSGTLWNEQDTRTANHGSRLTMLWLAACDGCAHLCTLVQGLCTKGAQRKSLIYIPFNQSVRVVRIVQAFSSSFSHVHALLILSSKSNFDSKKGAQCAQIALALTTVAFQQFQKVHRYAHRPCTDPLLSAQIPKSRSLCPLTADHEQRTTIQAYRFALHAHRSVFLGELGNSTIGCLPQ